MIGKKIIHKDTVDSTNNYVANLLLCEDLLNGTVILADNQTKGRGQRGSQWDAEAYQNLTMSVYLKHDNLSVSKQFLLAQFTSIAIIEFLQAYEVKAEIKWPNDIVVGPEKIAGILIENQLEQDHIKSSIIGIGININQQNFSGYKATSLSKLRNQQFNVAELGLHFIEKLREIHELILLRNYTEIRERYLKNVWLLNKMSVFEDRDGKFSGTIVQVDQEGYLHVDHGTFTKKYGHKEISFLERL